MAFNITDVLGSVSKANPGQEQIVYIKLELLDPDPDNFYTLEGIEDLADNISLIGLQQPIRIRPGKDGHYIVVSGHRRRAAIMLISHGDTDNAHMFDGGVPCIIDNDECSPAMRELRLIYANSATRVMTPAEVSKQAERIEAILYQLSEEGVEFKGRMRDHVAKACAVSKSKIARLHAIRNNMVPELLEEFDAGRLNESVAYRISQEKAAVQHELAKRTGPSIRDYDINRTEAAIAQVKEPKPAAPEPKFDGHGHLEFDGRTYLAERAREDEEYYEMLKEEAVALLRRVPGFRSRQEGIEQLKSHHGQSHHGWTTDFGLADASPKGLAMEKWRPGQKDVKIMRTWTEVYDMLSVYVINRAEQFLAPQVSEPDTGPQWQTGEPKEPGSYVVIAGYQLKEQPACTMRTFKFWDGDGWHDEKTHVPFDMTVYRWFKLPEDE